MSKPDLKFGRKVIAWENNVDPVKGRYLIYQSHGQAHWILCDDGTITPFKHAKPDPEGTPMNGDEVIGKYGAEEITGRYVGLDRNGYHVIDNERVRLICCDAVRHPQSSKRERVVEMLMKHEEIVTANIVTRSSLERLADEILKITEE